MNQSKAENEDLVKVIREQQNKAQLLEFIVKESLKLPDLRFYTLWQVHQWSDNPASFMYLLLHGITLGLIPYYTSSSVRYDYIVVQNGQYLMNEGYPIDVSTFTWSPLLLTGNTKFPDDIKNSILIENCSKLTEKLLMNSLTN